MTEGPPQVARVEPGEVSAALVTALHTGAVASRADVGVIALTGPGAVTCFQGLLTNDIELPGDGAFVYGALLTPKGMIVADGWAARLGATVSYTVPAVARESALNILTRSVPPRLARHSVSDHWTRPGRHGAWPCSASSLPSSPPPVGTCALPGAPVQTPWLDDMVECTASLAREPRPPPDRCGRASGAGWTP